MDQLDNFKGWIKALAANLNLELELDEENTCTLTYGRDMCISISPSPSSDGHFMVAGPVFALTQDPAVDYHIYKKALELSFMGEATCGGTIGLVNDGLLVLGLTVPYDRCDAVIFNNTIVNFAGICQDLHERISRWNESGTEKKDPVMIPPGGIPDFA